MHTEAMILGAIVLVPIAVFAIVQIDQETMCFEMLYDRWKRCIALFRKREE